MTASFMVVSVLLFVFVPESFADLRLLWRSTEHASAESPDQEDLIMWASKQQGLNRCAGLILYDTQGGASAASHISEANVFPQGTMIVDAAKISAVQALHYVALGSLGGSCSSVLLLLTSVSWRAMLDASGAARTLADSWARNRRVFAVMQAATLSKQAMSDQASNNERDLLLHSVLRKSVQLVLCSYDPHNNLWRLFRSVLYRGPHRHTSALIATYHRDAGVRWTQGSELFSDRRFQDFEGYKFTIAALPYSPFIIEANGAYAGPGKYSGLEVRLIDTLASVANFTYEYKAPSDGEWGRLSPNGSWSGMIGLVDRQEADWAVSDITFSPERAGYVTFSSTFVYDASELLTPRALPLPLFLGPVKPFTLVVWVAVAAAIALSGPLLYIIVRTSPAHDHDAWFLTPAHAVMYTLQPVFNHGCHKDLSGNSSRVFALFWLLSAMIISILYSSSLTAFLILPGYTKPIMNLEQLVNSHIGWGKVNFGGVQNALLEQTKDPVLIRLREGVQWYRSLDSILKEVVAGKLATWDNRITTRLEIAVHFTDKSGQPLVTLTGFELLQERIAWPMTRLAPFKCRFDELIQRARQAGLVEKWLRHVISEQQVQAKQEQNSQLQTAGNEGGGEAGGVVVLSLDHFQGVFLVLVFGCFVGGFAFVGELVFHRYHGMGYARHRRG
ncbi:Ionotropic receptor 128 [Hyalella azteca]|uniref:Glutamate receptor ionotropic, delta-1-like isoform X2 n=1 Tax=Hyalella azteca TaxID=294128 RepID=A0A6A0H9Y2_HYAAZ|nr:glutamate receptor ionotropic, delta-1-like isoform X2 [Hyalella azteca]KAA0202084.1 Ionotropic receptor 128 [Hyalella azteca]